MSFFVDFNKDVDGSNHIFKLKYKKKKKNVDLDTLVQLPNKWS